MSAVSISAISANYGSNATTREQVHGARSVHASVAEGTVVLGEVRTPLGTFGAVFSPAGLGRLTFPTETPGAGEAWAARYAPGARVVADPRPLSLLSVELNAYLDGDLREFTTPLDLRGTPFQVAVWEALLAVGYGELRSYGEIAASIGKRAAVRAVGMANGSNPVPIIVPCHRVIGGDGKLRGFGGGVELKERLLRLEGVQIGAAPSGRQGRLL